MTLVNLRIPSEVLPCNNTAYVLKGDPIDKGGLILTAEEI